MGCSSSSNVPAAVETNDPTSKPDDEKPDVNSRDNNETRRYDEVWTNDDVNLDHEEVYLRPSYENTSDPTAVTPPLPEDNAPYLVIHNRPHGLLVDKVDEEPEPLPDDTYSSHFIGDHEHLKGILKATVTVPRNPDYIEPPMTPPEVPHGEKWIDPSFPKNVALKGYSKEDVKWKRPCDFLDNVTLFNEGTDRFDINQGEAGTCFFLSVVAAISDKPELMKQIFPEDAYNEETGVYHCRLWKFGQFQDIYVDDFIPVKYGTAWGASSKSGELWVTLLEKAFARSCGSYGNCNGGLVAEAFQALTGGVTESYDPAEKGTKRKLWQRMSNAVSSGSVVTASVPGKHDGKRGLVGSHGYSVTGASEVNSSGKRVSLLRIRNPWGKTEWTGSWSDNSREWNTIDKAIKNNLMSKHDDGEFWMDITNFCQRFYQANICNISPDVDDDGVSDELEDVVCMYGEWKGPTAASYKQKLDNPLFKVVVNGSTEEVPVVFEVSQPQLNDSNREKYKAIGLAIWKMKETANGCILEAYQETETFMHSPSMCERMCTPPGTYLCAPLSFNKGDEGEFLLRVFTKEKGTGSSFDKDSTKLFKYKPEDSLEFKGHEQVVCGKWTAGLNAGGWCSEKSFFTNPQYLITVPAGEKHSLTVSLVQASVQEYLTIGVRLYVYKEGTELPLGQDFLNRNWSECPKTTEGSTDKYIMGSSETTTNYRLPTGKYVALATTDKPEEENEFVLILRSDVQLDVQSFNTGL